jgi:UDP-3-O-[3-hydroxymyristoyl] N-acetylglucosamine deacetylase
MRTDATGRGLHTGARVELTLRPAAPDTGIVFHRVDLAQRSRMPAPRPRRRRHRGCLDAEPTAPSISTVEHLMSALAGLGIDNLHVDVAGPEMPIMDGSAVPFVFLLPVGRASRAAGAKRYLRVVAPSSVATATSGRASSPFDGFRLTFTDRFPHPVFRLGEPARGGRTSPSTRTSKECARAARSASCRTSRRCARGLALGGSLHNAIVPSTRRAC